MTSNVSIPNSTFKSTLEFLGHIHGPESCDWSVIAEGAAVLEEELKTASRYRIRSFHSVTWDVLIRRTLQLLAGVSAEYVNTGQVCSDSIKSVDKLFTDLSDYQDS